MQERLAAQHIVLLGVGHTNAHIVRQWQKNPLANTDLTCISDRSIATYSGRLPAVLARQYDESAMQIDLVQLCGSAGARLLTATVTGLDLPNQKILFADRPAVPFDALSIGIGSVPVANDVTFDGRGPVLIKPMQTFLPRLKQALADAESRVAGSSPRPLEVVTVGSGAAGIEVTLCLRNFLRKQIQLPFQLSIVSSSDQILPGSSTALRRKTAKRLQTANVSVTTGRRVTHVGDQSIVLDDGTSRTADLVIWSTGASAPPLLSDLDLPVDSRGFLLTDNTLRSTAGVPVFAVGDSGTIQSEHLPKAGVYAVRQGPVLWDNLQRQLKQEPLQTYQPQRSFLKLLNTGDGQALGEWKGLAFSGRWVMKLKDFIDGRFLKMYQMNADMSASMDEDMQCRGCGCKLSSSVLDESLSTVATARESLDDAAMLEIGQQTVLASTDFFTSPVDDPYLAGRIAALHSASDLIAMGATVQAALANVVVPEGPAHAQQQALSDVLEGARREFETLGASVVGGHTIVGPRWEIGFTVIGQPASEPLLRKSALQVGDRLLLTKPLGIGVLLAAAARNQCPAVYYEAAVRCMLRVQHRVAQLATQSGALAGTDVTGFGLAGHLLEMLKASNCSAELALRAIPLLPGTEDLIRVGIESSLFADNYRVAASIGASEPVRRLPAWKALFDPQTCGGLLLAMPAAAAAGFQRQMQDLGESVFDIGAVTAPNTAPKLSVVDTAAPIASP